MEDMRYLVKDKRVLDFVREINRLCRDTGLEIKSFDWSEAMIKTPEGRLFLLTEKNKVEETAVSEYTVEPEGRQAQEHKDEVFQSTKECEGCMKKEEIPLCAWGCIHYSLCQHKQDSLEGYPPFTVFNNVVTETLEVRNSYGETTVKIPWEVVPRIVYNVHDSYLLRAILIETGFTPKNLGLIAKEI